MTRRRGKRRHKRDAPVAPAPIHQETTTPTPITLEIVEIQHEIETLSSPDSIAADVANLSAPALPPGREGRLAPPLTSRTDADRRAHRRYAFTAAFEIVAAESGLPLKTRVRDLSQQGCYVDTERPLTLGTGIDIRITKNSQSFEARARVVYIQPGKGMGLMFTSIPREQLQILDTWIAESRETSWLAANRRRSQRVLVSLPVRVSGLISPDSPIEEETHTVAISAHGAMIQLEGPVYRGQRLTLLNIQTNESLECVAAHVAKANDRQSQVGLEFMLPNPTFWRVAFPPKDWSPRHPDAKSS